MKKCGISVLLRSFKSEGSEVYENIVQLKFGATGNITTAKFNGDD